MSFINAAFAVWVAFLGLCVGSFLNVVIGRVPVDESIVRPGSRCPKCKTPIAWYDNIPVVSWLLLRGKCRHCKTPISPRYILVELLVGVLYLLCYQKFGWSLWLPGPLIFIGLLVALTFIDAEHWILPFEITLPGIIAGLLLSIVGGLQSFYASLFGAILGFLGLRAVEYFGWLGFRKEAMGAGDKYLFAMIGAFLGWQSLLGVLMLASFQGSAFGIGRIIALRKKKEEAPAPTAPVVASLPTVEPIPGTELPSRSEPLTAIESLPSTESLPGSELASGAQPPPGSEPLPGTDSSSGPQPTLGTESPSGSESPPAAEAPAASASDAEPAYTMTWEFLKPGLSVGRRLWLLPYSILLQPIPDPPLDEQGVEIDWKPEASNIPFGPWLALAALEILLWGDVLSQRLPLAGLEYLFGHN